MEMLFKPIYKAENMSDLLKVWEIPDVEEMYMIVGWRQWADAGSISSGLPDYLIHLLKARKIGEFVSDGYYLFQIPGTHDLVRPEIKLEDGYPKELEVRRNEIFYAGINNKGLLIFTGDEPHMNVERYARTFFEVVRVFNVKRVTGVAGIYAPIPYNKDRQIACIYSLKHMKEHLEGYAMRFSNYEGGSSIGSYLVKLAEAAQIEFQVFYGMVPAYDFGQSPLFSQGVRIESDYKAWYDILFRVEHMFRLGLDLGKLERKSQALVQVMDKKLEEMAEKKPDLPIEEYMEQVADQFEEMSFIPLDDVWERELEDLFKELDEGEN